MPVNCKYLGKIYEAPQKIAALANRPDTGRVQVTLENGEVFLLPDDRIVDAKTTQVGDYYLAKVGEGADVILKAEDIDQAAPVDGEKEDG